MSAARGSRPALAPARACAFAVVRRVFEQGAYADRAFTAEAQDAGLDRRDRALATALAYGTVQRKATLDHVADLLSTRPTGELDPPLLAALRLGLYQLLFMGGVADHAAVNDSVELAKRANRGGAGLVNAVLRRATREGRAIVDALTDDTPAGAAVAHSVPQWLAERWWSELGEASARELMAHVNESAEAALRVNTLVATPAEVSAELPVPAHPATELPEGLVVKGPFDAHGSELWRRGAIMPQSRGSMLASRLLAPDPGQRVLDLCAAPGGKTTHLAALMGDEGSITAIERRPGRARALRATCERMRASCVTVEVGDAAHERPGEPGRTGFDGVLVDPPCSGLGTLQSRPDLRWRLSPEQISELGELQGRLLAAGAAATAPGGVLAYSVCTISRVEGDDVIERFLATHDSFAPQAPSRQLLPSTDGTDGFFLARLRRDDG